MAGHLVKYGKHRVRRSYSRIKEVLDLPNLIEVQTDSYKWFLDEGLREMFDDIMPIEDFQGKLSLEFVDYQLLEPKYTVEEARQHDANYSAPLHVTLRLINHETGEIKSQDVFFGDFPLMTKQGTFIINNLGVEIGKAFGMSASGLVPTDIHCPNNNLLTVHSFKSFLVFWYEPFAKKVALSKNIF